MAVSDTNLQTLISVLQAENAAIFDQKSRLEAKAVGYITAISLILAAALGVLTFYFSTMEFKLVRLEAKIVLLSFVPVAYFSLVVVSTSVLGLLPRDLAYIDEKDVCAKAVSESENTYLGSIAKTYATGNEKNRMATTKASFYNDLSNVFLIFAVAFNLVFMAITYLALIN